MTSLSDQHWKELIVDSVIAPEIIEERGYESITNPRALPPQFTGEQRTLFGMTIPVRDVTGEIATYQIKPDNPRTGSDGRKRKYETAAGGRFCLDVPTRVRPHLRDPNMDLWITEGCKKVDSALSNGIPCIIGLLGVDGWQSSGMALPDWKEISLRDRRVITAFDGDVMTKTAVRSALERLAKWLDLQRADVRFLILPPLDEVRS